MGQCDSNMHNKSRFDCCPYPGTKLQNDCFFETEKRSVNFLLLNSTADWKCFVQLALPDITSPPQTSNRIVEIFNIIVGNKKVIHCTGFIEKKKMVS